MLIDEEDIDEEDEEYKAFYRSIDYQCNMIPLESFPVLEPERIINRALYGTDYNPTYVSFSNRLRLPADDSMETVKFRPSKMKNHCMC